MLHIGMASNSDWVVPASHDERRYAMLEASVYRQGQREYFKAITGQMESGGLAAMIYDMLHRDIRGFEVRDIPDSKALTDQKKLSLDQLDRWWLAVLERGFVWRSRYSLPVFSEWQEFYPTELLYASYLRWCEETRVQWPDSRVRLGQRLSSTYSRSRPDREEIVGEIESTAAAAATLGRDDIKKAPELLERELIVKASRPPGYKVESLDEARARFSEVRGVTGDWGEPA